MTEEKLLLITSLDYIGTSLITTLRRRFEKGLCVVYDDSTTPTISASELTTECQRNGYSTITSSDIDNVIAPIIKSYKADFCLFIGDFSERNNSKKIRESVIESGVSVEKTLDLNVGGVDFDICDNNILNVEFGGGEKNNNSSKEVLLKPSEKISGPSWPEFDAIFNGISKSVLTIAQNVNEKILAQEAVNVKDFDTAISVRYKHVANAPRILQIALDKVFIGEEKTEEIISEEKTKTAAGLYLNHSWDECRAERFIRAMQFPPYDAALINSKIDGVDYFVDHIDQYVDYRRQLDGDDTEFLKNTSAMNIGQTHITNASSSGSNQKSGSYANDTHWYSNVGGTIVKVAAEKMKLRRKERDFIPGQAISTTAKKRLRMNEPLIGLTAKCYIGRALTSSWIGVEGPYIKKFEASLAKICQVEAVCAVQSGTAALYGAMKALGVSDKLHHVIVPSYTCAACADAIVHAGGIPIPVDCETDSYGLSFNAVAETIESDENVCGVVIAPTYGVPSRDHMKIYNLCSQLGLWLCEDNCETYGAKFALDPPEEGKNVANANNDVMAVGSMSTMSVVSVRSEKMVGVGEGGCILSKDAALVSRARWWCSRAPVRGCGLWRVYEHEEVGQNFRLPEILGAVGVAACENLPVMIERKRQIHDWYMENLSDLPYLHFQKPRVSDEPVWWLNSIRIDPEKWKENCSTPRPSTNFAEKIGMALMEKYPHIEIRPAFFPIHKMSCFSKYARACPQADFVYDTLFCLPSSALLTKQDVADVCDAVKHTFREFEEQTSALSVM